MVWYIVFNLVSALKNFVNLVQYVFISLVLLNQVEDNTQNQMSMSKLT